MAQNDLPIFDHYPHDVDSNRRNDQPVRSAIDTIQDLLFDPQASTKVFPLVLNHITDITNSDYSAIFMADMEGNTPITPSLQRPLHTIYPENSVGFIQTELLSRLIKKKQLPMRATLFNTPIPEEYCALLVNPDQISALCVLPIISQNKLTGICVLGKKQGHYSSHTIQRLMPILGSVICTLQSAESVKGNFIGFDQKITGNRYLSSLLSSSPTAIIVVSPNKKIFTSNPAAQDMFNTDTILFDDMGEGEPPLSGQNIEDFIPNYDSLFKWSNQRARYGSDTPLHVPQVWDNQTALRRDGTSFMVNMTVFRYTHGNQRYTTLQIQDITALRESAEEYQQASQQLNALTHLVPVGIIRVNHDWNCVYANDKWHDFSGLTHDESTNQQWINAIHSDDVKTVLEELRDSLQIGHDYQREIRLVSPLGQIRWVEFNTRVLFNDKGTVEGFLGTFADITERLLHQEKLRQVAEYDSLTGLANRHLFQDRLQQAFYSSQRDQSTVSLLFLDLDGFKDINDTMGHDAGDLLLQQVAQRLLNTLRRKDTIARFGGDEFVVLLGNDETVNKEKTHPSIHQVAQKMIDEIAQPYSILEQEVFITISIGIAEGSDHSSSPEQLLKQADTALYLAKKEGKNNFQLFNQQLDKDAKNRMRLANQLRVALKKEQYSLFFQAVADVHTQQVVGFESLLRLKEDNHTVITPEHFIPILEETGMIIDVGRWVIEEACKQLKQWQQQGLFPANGFLAVNVSAKQLLDESIVDFIQQTCHRYAVDPRDLLMEITESVIISKPKKAERILNNMKNIGLRLALDDFGTGYSSLSYLQKFPFDHIKVDKSFVDDLAHDSNDAKITRAIIALANSLGLKVTAEGVEDFNSLSFIQEFGATYFQGYYLSQPAEADQAIMVAESSPLAPPITRQTTEENTTI